MHRQCQGADLELPVTEGPTRLQLRCAGNRTRLIYLDSRSVAYTFDAANPLQTALELEAGTTSYYYDDNGNLTGIYPPGSDAQNPAGVLHYDCNQRNLMVSHEANPDGTAWVLQAAHVYDGANDRL